MEHLDYHGHAYIDENNIVVNILVFSEDAHNTDLPEQFLEVNNAKQVICCCTYGEGHRGDTWTGTEFRFPQTYPSWIWNSLEKKWEAPLAMPDDGEDYLWNEETVSWDIQPNPRIKSLNEL
jgi:hypothetical protein